MMTIARVNSSFLRRSGVLNARVKAVSTGPPGDAGRSGPARMMVRQSYEGYPGRWLGTANGVCRVLTLSGEPAAYPVVLAGSGGGDRAAGGFDLLLGGCRELVSGHVDLDGDLAGAENLDRGVVADRTLGHEVGDGHIAALGEQGGQLVQVDDLELHAEGVLEATQLGQAHVQRHGATLETLRDLVAGLGALGATAGGLALGALTATHAGLGGLGTRGGTQVVHLEGSALGCGSGLGGLLLCHGQSTSSTATRCVTVLTIPRISGRSSLTTTSPMRFRPRLRSVSRWFCLPPISERIWVTLRRAITHQPSRPRPWPRRDLRHGP